MPLIVFGDGLADKSSVRFRSFRHGVPEKAYKHLLVKQKIGEVYLLDTNEFNTDAIAARNILYIVEEIWSGNGRPEMFTPQPRPRPNTATTTITTTTTTKSATMNVVAPHSGGRT
ncbi:hypothetical protein PHYBLDRAFT_139989 [Phycomyces blakesleeanus NRRL 1555(-)]|uniref:Uncharacterized protein n=1 Tax=Phycomyces blakesleeanus (strain ATCC 8743b / DSM 1359 / FGSC 10004 / NBRC 33097 / NRRL 1555) TaxID=763407 RepID=A0A167QNS8_PHYB8|nr:hypothetical protein PHYBLDRAFT_139989 [Phycomyces blakesleeanus NRRL 1555(-)]OAD79978.1 hypothetical protein PHYBLDRAFT_139989 [Phycomyces blakesleeanus NRRL 1555(-)]|eukprot:XP_018298018.1 hypothetical protein PHYBLDRAFT_139989 [Phycomyces blakesleeanus NRRL 1555(-)]